MSRIRRKEAVSIAEVLQDYLKSAHLSSGLGIQRVFSAWNDASGAEKYTVRRYFRDGTLYITVSSSVVRSQLYFQKDALIEKMNSILDGDSFFSSADSGSVHIKELILK